jgi:eukaryotic-like serine/threonine-protein kinase
LKTKLSFLFATLVIISLACNSISILANKETPLPSNTQGQNDPNDLTSTKIPVPTMATAINPTLTLTSGDANVSGKDGMVMTYIPEGEFLMGTTDIDASDAVENCMSYGGAQDMCENMMGVEKPQHSVFLDAYWIDRTEVTNAMYEKCVSDEVCDPPHDTSSETRTSYYGNSQYADYPIIWVNWGMASTYCQWAGRRLPTEAEWEKAARGTDGRLYPWGNERPNCDLVNFVLCEGDTAKVGSFLGDISPYGVMDMAGNVSEWVNDWYRKNYYSNSSLQNPLGPPSGEYRVIRGASWTTLDVGLRVARRYYSGYLLWNNTHGFRCALSEAIP